MASNILLVFAFITVGVVLASPVNDEPIFTCLSDEQYIKCADIICYKTCEHLKNPPACPALAPDCFNPSCECKDGKLRNSSGECVFIHECK